MRFPGIPFEQADIEDRKVSKLGQFDFVLCFGLLYHLENPLQAIRNLRAITEKCVLLESMCLPEEKCSMLLSEEPRQEDQSLSSDLFERAIERFLGGDVNSKLPVRESNDVVAARFTAA